MTTDHDLADRIVAEWRRCDPGPFPGHLSVGYLALIELVEAAYQTALEDAAKVARYEGIVIGCKKRPTDTLNLTRDPYPHEIANEIADAILATPRP